MANNRAIIIPEVLIYNFLKFVFEIVKEDFNSNSIDETILYTIFNSDEDGNLLTFENFNYLQQAKELFIDRTPTVNLGYNLEIAGMGSVHILLPSEDGQAPGIGNNENYQPNIEKTGFTTPVYTQSFNTTFNLMISSENSFEVLMIYHLLKVMIVSFTDHLELAGIRMPKISGSDVSIQSELVPTHIFHRNLMLNFFYELNVLSYLQQKIVKNVKVTSIIKNENDLIYGTTNIHQ